MPSVLQEWVFHVPCKMQSVMMCALRGCDTVGKEDPSKIIVRALRSVILNDAEGKSLFTDNRLGECLNNGISGPLKLFIEDLDHYPVHFIMHLAHACEITGFKYPSADIGGQFLQVYHMIVEALHLIPESEAHLDIRLADKVFDDAAKEKYRSLSYSPDIRAVRVEFLRHEQQMRAEFAERERNQILRHEQQMRVEFAKREPKFGGYKG